MREMYDDFVLLIINCEKYRYKAQAQKEGWLANASFPYYHVLGQGTGQGTSQNTFEFDDKERILRVDAPDDYVSLPKKVMAAFAAVKQRFSQVKYIFKTDDDQHLKQKNVDNFFQMMRGVMEVKSPKVHYAGYIVDVKQPYLSKSHLMHPELPEYLPIYITKYCSGPFYILSIEAVTNLLFKRKAIEKEYFEDYAIGYHLHPSLKETITHVETRSFFEE